MGASPKRPRKPRRPSLAKVKEELAAGTEPLGEPEPQDGVEMEEAVRLRLGHSNDYTRAEYNARLNRRLLEKAKKPEKEIVKALEQWTTPMETALSAIVEIDADMPEARARAKEVIEHQRRTRERLRAGDLIQCPRCLHEFVEQ